MKRVFMMAACAAAVVGLSACSMTGPVAATSNPIGSKVGTASGSIFLGVFAFGADFSIRTASKNGGITKVATVDLKASNVLGLVQTFECIVTGD